MDEIETPFARDALDSPRGNLGACMWVRRELERQMAGLVSEAQRLIQYGGGIADFDAALARLNDRATYMRQHVAAVLAERCPARRQMNLSGSTAQVIDFIQSH